MQHDTEFRELPGTRDIWVRDFLPVQVGEGRFVKFRFAPSYLRDGYRHLITPESVCLSVPLLEGYDSSDINLDGGNVVASGKQVVLTNKVFWENPGWHRRHLALELQLLLQVEQCLFIHPEPGDVFGHADGVVRFLTEDTVLVYDYSGVDPAYGARLRKVLSRHGLRYQVLPYFFERRVRRGIPSAVGNYLTRISQMARSFRHGVCAFSLETPAFPTTTC